VKLFEEGVLTISKAAKLAALPVEAFMARLAVLGIVVVDQTADELVSDLTNIDE
jgi:predicted HTH domain antitoxin